MFFFQYRKEVNKKIQKLKKADLFFVSFLVLLSFFLYWPSCWYSHSPVDDWNYLRELDVSDLSDVNVLKYVFSPILDLHSPFVMFSFYLDRVLWGHEVLVWGLHITNLLLYLCSIVLLYKFLRIIRFRYSDTSEVLKFSPLGAAFAAAVWCLHPQRVESVAWIAERKDLLLIIVFFLTMICFIKDLRKKRFSLSAFLLFLISFSIKPMLISLPLLIFVWMILEAGSFRVLKKFKIWLPYVVFVAFAGAGYVFQSRTIFFGDENGDIGLRIILFFWRISNYFISAIIPENLMPFYPYYTDSSSNSGIFIFLCVYAALIILSFYSRIMRNCFLPLFFLFPFALLPVCIFRIGNVDWADRYNLIPSLFLLIPAVLSLQLLIRNRKFHITLVLIVYSSVYPVWLLDKTVLYLPVFKGGDNCLKASVQNVEKPNHRVVFPLAINYFENENFQKVREYVQILSNCSSEKRKFIRDEIFVFSAGMNALLEYKTGETDRGGEKITTFLFSPQVDYCGTVANGFIDLIAENAIHWNMKKNNAENVIRICRITARFSKYEGTPQAMHALYCLIKNNLETAEKKIKEVEKKNRSHYMLSYLKRLLYKNKKNLKK